MAQPAIVHYIYSFMQSYTRLHLSSSVRKKIHTTMPIPPAGEISVVHVQSGHSRRNGHRLLLKTSGTATAMIRRWSVLSAAASLCYFGISFPEAARHSYRPLACAPTILSSRWQPLSRSWRSSTRVRARGGTAA